MIKKEKKILLFGGRLGWPNDANDTWEWDGVKWTRVMTGGPSGRISSLVYDGKRKQVVLFGGAGGGPSRQTRPYYHDTWI